MFHFATLERCLAAQLPKTVDPSPQVPERGKLPAALISLHADGISLSRYALLVDKKLRTLMVWDMSGDRVRFVSAFGIDIGAKSGDKQRQGDQRTPEGIYFVQKALAGKSIDSEKYGERAFALDYPNTFDRLEKKTGGGIWLHAISDNTSLKRGSRGCVVVRNSSIEELARYIELKRTPVIVSDSVEYLNERDWVETQRKLMSLFEVKNAKPISGLQVFNLRNKIVARVVESDRVVHTLYAVKAITGDLQILSEN